MSIFRPRNRVISVLFLFGYYMYKPYPNKMNQTPVAIPIPAKYEKRDSREPDHLNVSDAVLIPGTNSTVPVAVPLTEQEERQYETGHAFMDLQEEYDFGEEEDKDDPQESASGAEQAIQLCLCRIRQDYVSPFLEFLVEKTEDAPNFICPFIQLMMMIVAKTMPYKITCCALLKPC